MKRPAFDRDAWRGLDIVAPPDRTELRVAPADVLVDDRSVLYAIDAEGLYHLLVPLRHEVDVVADRRSSGVHLDLRILTEKDQETRFLDVACRKRHLREVFMHLADEMVRELRQDASQPVATCRSVLIRWRELLSREISHILSEQVLLGLFGELWHLREIARVQPAALDAWIGPSGAKHDFLRDSTALEVKTSQKADEHRFEVHGVDQLDPPADGILYFAATIVEQCNDGGESIPELIAAIQEYGVDTLELMSKLAALGYRSTDENYYAGRRFKLVRVRFYMVGEVFPRIVRQSFAEGALPPRVVRLAYIIDLAGMEHEALPNESVAQIYSLLAGE
jgi:hypothetical protein